MRAVGRAKRLVNELTSTRLVAGLRVPHDLASWAPTWKTELLQKLLAGGDGVLVDVGANVGQTLLDYVHLGGRGGYVGFEPLPAAAACVQRVIDDNGLSQAVLVPIALSDRPTVSAIHIPEGDLRSASLERDLRPRRTTKIQWVSAHALDDIWSVLAGGRRPAAVKIDVEGAELPALRGMRGLLEEHRVPVLCEVLDADDRADMAAHERRLRELERFLQEIDYTIKRIVKPGGALEGMLAVSDLPRRRWRAATAEECDYLFTASDWDGDARS